MKNNEIVPFGYNDQLVRTVMIDGAPWFVAKDVCAALDIKNPSDAIKILDDDEKNTLEISEGIPNRGNPNMNIINESGLYTLILRSNKPEAKKFRKWVTSEVLPNIRKNGVYDITGAFNDRLERMEKALEDIKKGQLQISAQPEITDPETAMLCFGGKFLEVTGKESDIVEAWTLYKVFKRMYKVKMDSHTFMNEMPYVFTDIYLDTRRKYKPLFRGCLLK
ncbi:Bro-N domain-containing protein [Treponema sp. OMZ 788]|nr:Bro-N domain-containing protein [Treponema sp. OMZ 788]